MQPDTKRKLLLVGWDAADWQMIHPLLDRGEMPNLQRLVENGVSGNLLTLEPAISPLLWTTIATGKTADEHRVLSFLEPDPFSAGARPIASTSRQGKAIWNILHQAGLHPNVVNWFASHPAEPIRGVCVSNPFCLASPSVPTGAVNPPDLERAFLDLRVQPGDLSGHDLALFIPELQRIDQTKDRRLVNLASVLAEGLTVHALATWILEKQPWDFVAMFMDTIDHAGHFFMQYHPPRRSDVSDEDFAIYQGVMSHVYRFHDLLLGRLLQLAGPEATVMIVSDHGFKSGGDRPQGEGLIPLEENLRWHRPYGIFCLTGPGIRKDELVHGAGLLDIAPTILALFGLPAGKDMPGRALAEAFVEPPGVERIESWEAVAGEAGMHAPDLAESGWDAAAAIEQLAALGYVEPAGEFQSLRRQGALDHQSLSLGRVYLSQGKAREAVAEFERLNEKYPGQAGVLLLLTQALLQAGETARCRELLGHALDADSKSAALRLVLANVYLAEGANAQALEHLLAAEDEERPIENWHLLVGRAHLRLGRAGDAAENYRNALGLNPQSARALRGLAAALLGQQRPLEAAKAALESTGLEYGNAGGHYLLGVSLARVGQASRAIQAFEICLKLKPGAAVAHRWLTLIHEQATGDVEKARYHAELAAVAPGAVPQPHA